MAYPWIIFPVIYSEAGAEENKPLLFHHLQKNAQQQQPSMANTNHGSMGHSEKGKEEYYYW